MRILFLGDLVGRAGRQAAVEALPGLRHELSLDLVICNGENAAAGFGITPKICQELFEARCDIITTGNHVWDQKEIKPFIGEEPRLLRPINYPPSTPGNGHCVYELADGRKVLVVNAMARVFMDPLNDPFEAMDALLAKHRLGGAVQAAVLDFHGETTSEKMAMAHYLDGRVSLVVGTHTHVPTADAQIFEGGTAYQTDAGMCGDYNSVIGMEKDEPIRRFTRKMGGSRFGPAMGEATLCGVVVETNDKTGLAISVEPFRKGGRLKATG